MKNLDTLDKYRIPFQGDMGDEGCGAFKVYVGGKSFFVIASDDGGWDHVSVSMKNQNRCPTWEEMSAIKDMFFEPGETVMQLHPAKSDYINVHPYCLHLWRPHDNAIPLPPKIFV